MTPSTATRPLGAEAADCFCGCGKSFPRRRKSMPLCRTGFNRANDLMLALPLLDEMNAEHRRSNRFWASAQTVAAALAADRLARR